MTTLAAFVIGRLIAYTFIAIHNWIHRNCEVKVEHAKLELYNPIFFDKSFIENLKLGE